MLHHLQPFVQRLLIIAIQDGDLLAADDGAGVYFGGDVVDAASCDLDLGVEGLLNGVEAAKDGNLCAITGGIGAADTVVGQQGGMDVDDALGELLKKFGAEDTHPTGEYDKFDLKELKQICE